MEKKYNLNSIVTMKKKHACGSNEWTITRVGADIKIRCNKCHHEVMMDRLEFNKKLKKVCDPNETK